MPQPQTPHIRTVPGRETFSRADRIRRRGHYLSVQKQGKRVYTDTFVFVLLPNVEQGCRLGITVTRKVKRAVDRNRIKRLLREAFRRNRCLFPLQSDLVVIARPGVEKLGYLDVCGEIRQVERALARAVHRARSANEQTTDRGKARRS